MILDIINKGVSLISIWEVTFKILAIEISKERTSMKKGSILIIGIFILLVSCSNANKITENLTYETKFDETLVSPNEVNTIIVRYDYVSRPSVFLITGELLFEYSKPGFMETVNFEVKWINDYEFVLFNERFGEEYQISIPE